MDAEKLLKHMAWANEQIYTKVAALPDEALKSFAVNPQWSAAEIVRHINSSATWYGWRLLDKSEFTEAQSAQWQEKLDRTEIQPASSKDVIGILEQLKDADKVLLEAARLPEGVVLREDNGKIISRARSTVISQAVHHATEHRAQLISALEAGGFTSINLDDYDLWAFSSQFGE
ncbi:DNA damage-inducible protein DinB [Candidatus Nanopelagicaceae bacterium]